jgi:hypothetical protein
VGLATILNCLRFATSLFVASYDSQGYGGGNRPRLHTGKSISSVSHPLKKILCRLHREHLLHGFSFSVHENTSVDSQHLTIGCLCMLCRVNVFVTQTMIQKTCLPSRCLAMDSRSDSGIPAFSGTPQYNITCPGFRD